MAIPFLLELSASADDESSPWGLMIAMNALRDARIVNELTP